MSLKKWLLTSMTMRNMLADFGFRKERGDSTSFTEYFQYALGPYSEDDYILYFPKKPFWDQYRNEAFNKLRELDGPSINKYLSYHYERFPDKPDFLSFVKYETSLRL